MPPEVPAHKFLCNICKIWIADNKPQRDLHENGQRHKTNKLKLLKEIERKNNAKQRDSSSVFHSTAAQQLLEIAARAANSGIESASQEKSEGKGSGDYQKESGISRSVDSIVKEDPGPAVEERVKGIVGTAEAKHPEAANEVYKWEPAVKHEDQKQGRDEEDTEKYPEPANKVYVWETIEKNEESDGNAGAMDGSADNTEERVELEQKSEEVKDTEEEALQRKQLEGSFKRRKAPLKRMQKRRR